MRSWIPRYVILPLRFVNFDNLVSLLVTVWPGVVGRGPQVLQWELGALLGSGPSGCEVIFCEVFQKEWREPFDFPTGISGFPI